VVRMERRTGRNMTEKDYHTIRGERNGFETQTSQSLPVARVLPVNDSRFSQP
jgi:hypothetical protein